MRARVGVYQEAVDGRWDVQEIFSAGARIAEEWTVWDALGLLQQVGAVPAPDAAAGPVA